MKKSLKIILGVVIAIIAVWLIIFIIDFTRCSNMKMPIFVVEKNDDSGTYYGLGYMVKTEKYEENITKVEMYMFNKFMTGAVSEVNTNLNNKNNNTEHGRIVMVNGKLYYDTGKESTLTGRCGVMDGKITSNIEPTEIPKIDNQSNFAGEFSYQYGIENTIEINIDNKWIVFQAKTEEIATTLTLEDEIQNDTIWCGTFQLIWNDLKNDLAKQDIVFTPQLKVVENLNKETFTTNDISDKYYYKKMGRPTIALKEEIEKAIKDKFNETSDILNGFTWNDKDDRGYFLYAMLKKEFQFETAFEELENGNFENYENVKYFGIEKNSESEELRNQVEVLYYDSKDNFAIKLKTKQEDEVILCKNPEGNTFNEIYQNITKQTNQYKGEKKLQEGELLKVPNIKLKEKAEFTQIEGKPFLFTNGDGYEIEKALQTIEFKLDRTGGKIKSEAGMMLKKSIIMLDEIREFSIDDTFTIFLVEEGKDTPYFAGKINDITKFQ